MAEITHFKIFGERCSGTYLLEDTILKNFDVALEKKRYGHKHFFYDLDLSNSDNTLFICTVRDPIKWLNSLYRTPHHLPKEMCVSPEAFLTHEATAWTYNPPRMDVYSKRNQAPELKAERNPFTGETYKNIFELRHIKNKWMSEELPKIVKNHIFIRYEDLVNNFEITMQKIRDKGLKMKGEKFVQIDPSIPVREWMKNKPCDELKISKEDIPEEYREYEKILGYF